MSDADDEAGGTTSCTCGSLERAAAEPAVPISFDEKTNEFSIIYTDGTIRGSLRVRFCTWCGGAAPRSKRASLFAVVTDAEERRLRDVAGDLWSVDEAIARLGPPDEDHAEGFVTHDEAREGVGPGRTGYRVIRYQKLSPTATLELTDFGPGRRLRVTVQGKYMGAPDSPANAR